jgi:hypothetical protein
MKEHPRERFSEVIGNINQCVDPFKVNKVTLDSFAEGKLLNVDVMGSSGGFLGIAHGRTSIVIFIGNGCGFLWDI